MTESRIRHRTALVLRLLTAVALGVDAYVHAHLASRFDGSGGSISQGTLFRLQAIAAGLVALFVLVNGRRLAAALALLVAASAFGAVMVTRYVDIGAIGPFPDMYDPAWYTEKTISAIAEGVAVVSSVALLFVVRAKRSR
jgi:hypothetical protein